MLRTHTCGELNKSNINSTVTLTGWVHRRRDHGGIIFIDLRDRYGLTQIKFGQEINQAAWEVADNLRSEWVIKATGKVIARPDDMVNAKLASGEIEVEIVELTILNKSKTPPFEIDEIKADEANEALRLKYRFVDLRRFELQEIIKTKDKFIQYIRKYFQDRDFIEIQTPILANSSPEGARDFLVPSRLHQGKFYALPQAPQQFKQLLMVGGLDKYFQIAPCFRDEDPRMDRHYGEFYQLDTEMSFVEQEDIFKLMEPLMIELTKNFSDKEIVGLREDGRFKQIPYLESMNKYGVDKPDLRFDMPIKSVSELVKGCGFKVFADMAEKERHVVHALKVDGGAKFTRKEIDDLTELAKTKSAKGLAYIVLKEDGTLQSPIVKFLGDDVCAEIIKYVNAVPGDIIFFGADEWRVVCAALGAVRNACGAKLGLKDNKKAAWCWVVDFPMYDYSEIEEGRIDFGHNPFSMPQGGLKTLNEKNPLDILAYQFDMVINGFEASSGAIRNHDPEIMYKAFAIAGYGKEEVEKRFGAMLRAFEFGAPPHGGNAPGIDRILMVLQNLDSIRDIYAFPKDGKGKDLMMDSPSEVEEKQLRDVHVKIR
ncbi:MAG: Aspartate-tRNA ligase [Candidatus Falkowbacteria bacterium GW2011_GWC2_38_22]|uniref:Aspartate--tRNA(Asp/Asn) ligase n=1 Tax=Candidatus Falkowbacteria bacterium GW2011_GWE1_38_31 TaxID=1618638 RepID=A0A0G0JQV1_9BACT|nr:MAG: Aspartate-tRNA ligase [Candidatus Falkowbacteria bacterium GW2011_GWF2_38_1205]KKQ61127.1 MAG: Aspartate-tRNA ligase [Candidatus Falkowbacteria bacterium GW2011_GWC2_38_22]KKQ63196.1 MAG: Aspartate-tRNA ligase [Candidatus Falkowbacteria bacterium GW2011_GWF1_38_22]KKQ65391.1 MAG: Aspartate-tRNA ligase [Candidatus Falkowbacteria bacterium GW2011_GWE2_38_254]KKQ69968.1 MAG: Aspartate-tRNA ligase [Candidatus Falkowbacteria bacterium GW2011_GWE1_38_31]KKQ72532.1 MAG: Aspartate-tRNA ligase 